MRRPDHQGALVAVWAGQRLLLLRQSYQDRLAFPGGGVRPGEDPADAARRELVEELELDVPDGGLTFACRTTQIWHGRRDTVTFFELRLDRERAVRPDRREVMAAQYVAVEDLAEARVSQPVAHYLNWRGLR